MTTDLSQIERPVSRDRQLSASPQGAVRQRGISAGEDLRLYTPSSSAGIVKATAQARFCDVWRFADGDDTNRQGMRW